MRAVRRGARRGPGRASTTTSSTSAGTRCWPPGWSAGSGRCSASSWPCGRCSRRRPWPELAAGWSSGDRHGRAAAAAAPTGRSGVPLSFAQHRLWFLDRLEGAERRPTTCRSALRLSGPLDRRGAARRRWRDVVARHESAAHRLPRRSTASRYQQVLDPDEPDSALTVDSTRPRSRLAGAGGAARPRLRPGRETAARGPELFRLARRRARAAARACTTSPATAGRWGRWPRDLAAAYAARRAGAAPGVGAAAGAVRRLHAVAAASCSATRRPGQPAGHAAGVLARSAGRRCRRSSRCRPTGRGPPSPATGARVVRFDRRRRRCTPRLRGAGPRPAAPPCSWCCRPRWRRC